MAAHVPINLLSAGAAVDLGNIDRQIRGQSTISPHLLQCLLRNPYESRRSIPRCAETDPLLTSAADVLAGPSGKKVRAPT